MVAMERARSAAQAAASAAAEASQRPQTPALLKKAANTAQEAEKAAKLVATTLQAQAALSRPATAALSRPNTSRGSSKYGFKLNLPKPDEGEPMARLRTPTPKYSNWPVGVPDPLSPSFGQQNSDENMVKSYGGGVAAALTDFDPYQLYLDHGLVPCDDMDTARTSRPGTAASGARTSRPGTAMLENVAEEGKFVDPMDSMVDYLYIPENRPNYGHSDECACNFCRAKHPDWPMDVEKGPFPGGRMHYPEDMMSNTQAVHYKMPPDSDRVVDLSIFFLRSPSTHHHTSQHVSNAHPSAPTHLFPCPVRRNVAAGRSRSRTTTYRHRLTLQLSSPRWH